MPTICPAQRDPPTITELAQKGTLRVQADVQTVIRIRVETLKLETCLALPLDLLIQESLPKQQQEHGMSEESGNILQQLGWVRLSSVAKDVRPIHTFAQIVTVSLKQLLPGVPAAVRAV